MVRETGVQSQVESYQELLKIVLDTSLLNYFLYYRLIGLVGRVFANGSGDWGSIPGRVIAKTFKKWYLIPPCLTPSNIRYVSRVKWSNPWKGVSSSPTHRCSSYWKGSLRVALDHSCQLYFFTIWIQIFQYIWNTTNFVLGFWMREEDCYKIERLGMEMTPQHNAKHPLKRWPLVEIYYHLKAFTCDFTYLFIKKVENQNNLN